jgi:hypothetical protein
VKRKEIRVKKKCEKVGQCGKENMWKGRISNKNRECDNVRKCRKREKTWVKKEMRLRRLRGKGGN